MIDESWYKEEFIQQVQKRGATIIEARGSSSAASAASAAIDHMRDWVCGSEPNNWVSMGVHSSGQYNVSADLIFSYPTVCSETKYSIVDDLILNEFSRKMIKLSEQELIKERDMVKDLLT
jgi:malate dehydrogenase